MIKGEKAGEERTYNVLNLQGNEITDNNHTEITGAEKSKLMPTDTGIVVNDFLIEYFPDILDYNFTASVEKQFDEIAEGDKQWTAILKTFYKKFHPSVENTLAAKTAHKAGERILGTDPVSGKQVSVKIGRFGPVAQIGTAEDEEKPRFAQVKKEMSIETITLEEALELFKLPPYSRRVRRQECSRRCGTFRTLYPEQRLVCLITQDNGPDDRYAGRSY